MINEILKKAGLNAAQSKTYLALIKHGPQSAAKLAEIVDESRTNIYQILDKLVLYDLVVKIESGKKLFKAQHPSAVEILAERRIKTTAKNEKIIKDNINELTDLYYEKTEFPTVRTITGEYGMKLAYEDILKAGQDVHYLRSVVEGSHPDVVKKYTRSLVDKKYHTYGLTQVTSGGLHNQRTGIDRERRVKRTWFPKNDYTGKATINVYGDRVSFIVFNEDQPISTIIYSQEIADAIKFLLEASSKYYEQNFDQN